MHNSTQGDTERTNLLSAIDMSNKKIIQRRQQYCTTDSDGLNGKHKMGSKNERYFLHRILSLPSV